MPNGGNAIGPSQQHLQVTGAASQHWHPCGLLRCRMRTLSTEDLHIYGLLFSDVMTHLQGEKFTAIHQLPRHMDLWAVGGSCTCPVAPGGAAHKSSSVCSCTARCSAVLLHRLQPFTHAQKLLKCVPLQPLQRTDVLPARWRQKSSGDQVGHGPDPSIVQDEVGPFVTEEKSIQDEFDYCRRRTM